MKTDTVTLINFLVNYADTLIGAGSYNSRVSRCIKRIANHYGYDVSLFIMIKSIIISVYNKENIDERFTMVKETTPRPVNLAMVSELSALSWAVCDENLNLDEAKAIYSHILEQKGSKLILSLIFIGTAFGAFCKLFGGDLFSIIFVIFGTMCGVSVRYFLSKNNVELRVIYVICAFISSFVAYLAYRFGLSNTPTAAISSSILYLFPGIMLLNSVFDILDRNVLIGLARMINASILIICMSIGIYITLSITSLGLS